MSDDKKIDDNEELQKLVKALEAPLPPGVRILTEAEMEEIGKHLGFNPDHIRAWKQKKETK